jgi:hypothetical protein
MVEPHAINTPFMSHSITTETESDYDGTVGALLRSLSQVPAETLPSAATIAAAIVQVAHADSPPLHLALKNTAMKEIHRELTARLRDLTEWEQFTRKIDDQSYIEPGPI